MSRPLLSPIYKDKVANGYSYPFGAEIVSEQLMGVPQFDRMSVHFRNGEGLLMGGYCVKHKTMKWKGDIKDLLAVKDFVTISFSLQQNSWSIIIRRVKSDHKQMMRQYLLTTGLPIIKKWLASDRPETWFNGYRTLEIGSINDTNLYAILEQQQISTRQIIDHYIIEDII